MTRCRHAVLSERRVAAFAALAGLQVQGLPSLAHTRCTGVAPPFCTAASRSGQKDSMTITRLVLLVMAVFIVVFAIRVFASGITKK